MNPVELRSGVTLLTIAKAKLKIRLDVTDMIIGMRWGYSYLPNDLERIVDEAFSSIFKKQAANI
jgi:hypothetical protein